MIQYKNTYKVLFLGCFAWLASAIAMGQEVDQDTIKSEVKPIQTKLNEEVNIGFFTQEKQNIVGATSTVKPDNLMKYDNSQWVRDALSGKVNGLKWSDNIRGLGTALIVVDGIPGRSIDLLNMEEIDEITILKDANATALYGSMARNGVIVVTTKRGKTGTKKFNISASTGIKVPTSTPKYLNSADYMELYNEARVNDGLAETYSVEEIENYRSGINPYRYPNVDFYSDEYLKSFSSFSNVTADFSGGVNSTNYYVNLGFKSDGNIQDVTKNDKGSKQFNVRGNIDFKVNDWIKSSLDVVGIIQKNRSSLESLYTAGASFKPNLYAPLLPVSMVDTEGHPELAGILDAANKYNGYILGGDQAFSDNTPLANVLAGGYQTSMTRISQMNNSIDFDLSDITEGLSAKTYISFDFYSNYNLSVNNKYAVYEPTWNDENMIVGLKNVKDADKKDQTEHVYTNTFIIRYGFYGLLNYKKQIAENHGINTSLIGFSNSTIVKSTKQNHRNSHVAFNFNYNYKQRLFADFSASYMNSIKLAEGNRGQFAPTVGLSYVVKEDLNADHWLNYLKVRASSGVIYSDLNIQDYFLYDAVYEQNGGGYGWGDSYSSGMSNSSTKITRGMNQDLRNEKRTDINIGLDALVFNKLWIEGNVFQTDMGDQVISASTPYPSYFTAFKPYVNYSKDRYKGFELGINYNNKLGKLNVDLGARALYVTTERIKVDQVKDENDLRYSKGNHVDGIYGLESDGFFTSNDFNDDGSLKEGIPGQYGVVKPGDLKYKNKNGDDVIDDRDMFEIGTYSSPWTFGSDITLNYGHFTLFTLLTAEVGGEAMLDGDYYQPQGNNKYSEIALGRWTEETASTATYPRLTSIGSTNNYDKPSTFWMYDNSNFKIQRVQLTYDMPQLLVNKLSMDDISIFVAGSNLIEFSKNKDIRELSLWGPTYRYYTLGIRMKF